MVIDYEGALFWKERTLQLVLALDKVRDSFGDDQDPQGMFDAIVALLRDQFRADACAIALVAEASDDVECVASVGFDGEEVLPLCTQALHRQGTGSLTTDKWAHTLGIQVILTHYPLAGLVLARQSEPFSIEETGLLGIAESQIDSAVIQARTISKLLQRNRELEAIYEIDRLRDSTPNEYELMSKAADVTLRRFDAALCVILLSDTRHGDFIIRGSIAEGDVPVSALASISENAYAISFPQVIPSPDEFSDFVLLAAPFVVAGERLGAIVLARRTTFPVPDHRLLYAIMSQIDSAVVHCRALTRAAGSTPTAQGN